MELFGVYGRQLTEVTFFGVYSSEDAAKARIEEIRFVEEANRLLDLRCHEAEGELPLDGGPIEFIIVPCFVDKLATWYL